MDRWFAARSKLRLFNCAAAALAMALAIGGEATAGAAPPPFLPIERQYLAVPTGMQPVYPTFLSDGRRIFFENLGDGTAWTIAVDGSDLRCVSCGFSDRPKGSLLFDFAMPDNKRLLLTRGVGSGTDSLAEADVWILECAPSLLDCASHRYLPLDMSADHGPFPIFQRRTWHLAPDGVHLGWMEVRADATAMVVARLERRADKYVAADPRVVNPIGPLGPRDENADRWENLSQLYELKSFTPDGRGILAVALPDNNVDILRIDLATGRSTRLTANPDWDEDSSLSPDQQLLVENSWRGRHRLDAFAWIPEVRGFTGLMFGAAIAPFYVSTPTGFQCDLSPWLLPATGDARGRLVGQPLDIYGGNLTAASNLMGQQVWSPDSTSVLLEERSRTGGASQPNRIALAHIDRAPTRPVPFVATQVGGWAPPAGLYRGPQAEDRTVVVRGRSGGRATVTYKGHLGSGASTSVVFDRFTDDGRTFVTGTMSDASAREGSGERRPWILLADIAVTGQHNGSLKMDLHIDNAARPLPQMSGTISAVYDGKRAPPLPPLAPCYESQPRATPLRLELSRSGARIHASVTADIDGDVRPVMNATLRIGASTARTDTHGEATLDQGPGGGEREVTASAGDTFLAARAEVPPR